MSDRNGFEIAVISLAGRFPGAPSVEELWRNLRDGVESISFFSPEELAAAGIPPRLISDPNYVPATGEIEGVTLFDAGFFNLTPREAELLDPQHRLLLECAWEALERAGHAGTRRPVGVFAGCSLNGYLIYNLFQSQATLASASLFNLILASDKDFLATRLSYKLNLEGPSMTVQTACSTSLVATHAACQSLLAGECELALAGGVSVRMPRRSGYLYQAGGIASPDGHCRAFDARANGTVDGEGVGVVVLKLLEDALADGDTVHAVIRGSAINNDGSLKAGFTAPRREGQAAAIRAALRRAEVDAGSIGYVETHGTATPIGDPIEIAALTQAFREDTDRRGFCAIGSIKTNIGHLDAAAGIASLIKAVLALEHREIPPSLHFETPNPEIDLASSPFRVAARLTPWETADGGGPRRAGVSSFGIGGTNAHVVLEEAPEPRPSGSSRPHQLLLLSARTAKALEQATETLAAFLAASPEIDPADVAWTLQAGRKPFEHRRALVCQGFEDAVTALTRTPQRLLTRHQEPMRRPVAFLFPGQGTQYAGMGRGLHEVEEVFRREIDACAEYLRPRLGCDLRGLLFPPEDGRAEAERALRQTRWAQPALFAVEYALARLWLSWGVTPWAMIGHSLGEYVAACLAGVLSLEDALDLVAARGELVQALPPGAMLSANLTEEDLAPLIGPGLSLAAVNGPSLCVASGPEKEIADLESRLAQRGATTRRLRTSHAFHSAMMDPVLPSFRERVARVELRAPALPWISNLTGDWITAEEATDPDYWVRHLRQTVRFGDGIARLLTQPDVALLEVGPGKALGSLARRPAPGEDHPAGPVIASMRPSRDTEDDSAVLLRALGRLWLAGVEIDWESFRGAEARRRVHLPTYPFQRQRYWIDPDGVTVDGTAFSLDPVEPTAKPLPGHARPELETTYQEPRDEREKHVAEIWSELLGIRAVGVHDNFFDLGGHSLLGTQVIARLRIATGVELPVSAIFESPTVAGLAARLEELTEVPAGPETRRVRPPLRRRPEGSAEPPLSFAQQRLWFLDQLAPGSPAYNIGSAFRLRGPLDSGALTAALQEIVRRHEALRTSFPAVDGMPLQRISPRESIELPIEDLTGCPEAKGLEWVRRSAGEMTRLPFDLSQGLLLRARLLRLAAADHVLLFTMHHIVSDGWSIRVLLSELVAIYAGFAAGRPSPLPELRVQYADYALWQREWLENGALAAQLSWWKERLAAAPPVLDLPTDRRRISVSSHRGSAIPLSIPADLAGSLARRAREGNASLFMALLAAFQVLLQRTSHQDDIVTGTPVAGRTSPELEGLIGFFINTLALRTDLSRDPSFRQLLASVRDATLGAYDHQDVPFDRLVDELQPERVLGRNPVFQALFQLHNQPVPIGDPEGLAVESIAFDSGFVRFELALSLTEIANRIEGILEYAGDLFDQATIQALADRFRRLLAGIAADPGRRLSEFPLLAEQEIRQILSAWDETGAGTVLGNVPEWIWQRAQLHPGSLAVVCEGESLTYGDLDRRAARLAVRLRALGVGPETPVALLAERSVGMVTGLLGIWRAGGAYLPLDPDLPAQRLAWMLEDSGAAVLVTQRELAGRFPVSLPVVLLEEEAVSESAAGRTGPETLPEALAGTLAYVIYTSGSTGRAKGVMVEHRQLAAYVRGVLERLAPPPGTSWATVSTIAADLGNTSIFAALCTGCTLHVITRDRLADPEGMAEYATQHALGGLKIVPSPLAALLAASQPERVLPRRLLVLGGEAPPWELWDRVRGLAPDLRIVNHYGPTETTVGVLTLELEREEESDSGSVPLGRPIPGTRVVLLDPRGQLVPRGIPGELHVGGAGVSRGYLGRPDLTAARFVPDPSAAQPGERLYRTGDLARHLPNGRLEFLGRADHQLKLRGFRVEPGEIESALRACPGVREAAVLVHSEGTGRRLVAYVAAGVPLRPSELRDRLRQHLPEVMVPAAFVPVEALPLNANGKLDRQALARVEPPQEEKGGSGAWDTPVEEVVAGIWAEVLEVPAIGPRDRFFDLGGHSLLATQVISRLRQAFGVGVPLRVLFDEPTVVGLAAAVEAAIRDGGEPVAPRIERAPRDGGLPLSFGQLRLWFLHRLEPESQAYNLRYVLRLSGAVDRGALARSLAEVVARHEALRTTFVLKDRAALEPIQVIQPAGPVPLPCADLTALPSLAAREREARRLAAEAARRPFDLERGPVLRILLIRLGEEDHALAFVLHHIASDGWSRGVMVRELAALYPAFIQRQSSPLPALPLQYADYAVWQRRWLRGEVLEGRLRWWRERLAGAPPALNLPADRPRPLPGRATGRAGQIATGFSADLVNALVAIGRRYNATLYMVLLAAWQTLLHRLTAETDLMVGTPIANRNRAEIEPLIGFFVNTLALRTDLAGNPTFPELIVRVRETALGAYVHQDLPFEKLVEQLAPERDLALSPLFQVMFVLHNAPAGDLRLPGLGLSFFDLPERAAIVDLTLSMEESAGRLTGSVEISRDRFDMTTAARLLGLFRTLLAGIARTQEFPERQLGELPLLADAERHQLLIEWNDTAEKPAIGSLYQLFAEQVERTPTAIAVVHGEERWTYRELHDRSLRLAGHLRRMGIGAEALVGVCLERSPTLLTALLGTLAAGGAYVPLDPSYPSARLSYMLEDSGAAFLLTQESLRERVADLSARIFLVDGAGNAEPVPDLAASADPAQLAYVIYTSGSTGRPKGVGIAHQNAVALVGWARQAFPACDLAGVLAGTSICFDLSVFEIFVPLSCGGTVILAANVLALPGLPAAGEVTLVNTVPSAIAELARAGGLPASVRIVNLAGETLQGSLVREVYAHSQARQVLNLYGPTEDTTYSTWCPVDGVSEPHIGRPLPGTRAFVLDAGLQPLPPGVPGELHLGGAGLARGYLGRPDLTAASFVPDPFRPAQAGSRLYRTGDLARWRPDGSLELLGRIDHQVKVRGFRIELGEVETALTRLPGVREAAVLALGEGVRRRLAAFVVLAGDQAAGIPELRRSLRGRLPEPMVPAAWHLLPALPLSPNGKVDRLALYRLGSQPAMAAAAAPSGLPRNRMERLIAAVWRDVLDIGEAGRNDNFFDLGGHSLLLLQVQAKLLEVLACEIPVVDLFRFPTVASLAAFLAPNEEDEDKDKVAVLPAAGTPKAATGDHRVAIIGMSGRFPGASSVEELWANLCAGVESIVPLVEDDLQEISPAVRDDPKFVRVAADMEGADLFDAGFFGFTPRDAEITDPQHRIFLECSWEVIESAGYAPGSYPGRIGVFAGVGLGTYLWNLLSNPEILHAVGPHKLGIATEKDHVTTTASYKLNLTGPSVAVQTACSTSLVAVHMACSSLLLGECEMALAGGARIDAQQRSGYLYQEGGIRSPDGHCRAFDARAQGTVGGNGAGVVLLKRLADALADGDPVHAVILGSAINNDGSGKVGYTAPGVDGQAKVIRAAQEAGGVEPRTVTYVEAHGTATLLGDPIEVAALTQAFGAGDRSFCALGSVKTNLGHLDAAAGVAGLIKAALAAEHGLLPPSLHFENPNPAIDFAASPFYVNTHLAPWRPDGAPRRAGVSSFGIGGTNAHVVLEEPPAINEPEPAGEDADRPALLVLSASTPGALERVAERLRRHLEEQPGLNLADVAWTLQAGRRAFSHRRALACRDTAEAMAALDSRGDSCRAQHEPGVAFLFPGQGAQYPGMGRNLYRSEPVFHEHVDRAAEILRPQMGLDLRDVLFPAGEDPVDQATRLADTAVAQPALFLVEHSLARLWMSWGVRPVSLIGHSLGEYVAACLAGVLSLRDALTLVAARGRLIADLAGAERGTMASLALAESEVLRRLPPELALAAVNGPSRCVVSGREKELEDFLARLAREGIQARRLHTSHAFHSELMEPVLAEYAAVVEKVRLAPPRLPFISNLTGTWVTPEQVTDPGYWVRHLRATVRFGEGLAALLAGGDGASPAALLEVGPGNTLTSLARRHPAYNRDLPTLQSLPHPEDDPGRDEPVYTSLGHLWTVGAAVDWEAFQAGRKHRRVRLPTYPFERQRYWIPASKPMESAGPAAAPRSRQDLANWFSIPYWRPAPGPAPAPPGESRTGPWLVFLDSEGVGERLLQRWRRDGVEAITVRPGERLARQGERDWILDPRRRKGYTDLLDQALSGVLPARVLHLWGVSPPALADGFPARQARLARAQDLGLYSLLFLSQALAERSRGERVEITVLTSNALRVTGAESLCPEKATVLGICQTLPSERSDLACRHVDLELPLSRGAGVETLLDRIAAEVRSPQTGIPSVAFRGTGRWVQGFEPARLPPVPVGQGPFREGGAYLLTGGLGGIALEIAEHLAAKAHVRLILVSRSGLPGTEATEGGHDARWLARREMELRRDLGVDLTGSAEADRALDAFCSARLLQFLSAGGIATTGDARFSRDEICERLRILPKFRKFVDFMVSTLADDGYARLDGDTVIFSGTPGTAADPEMLAREAASQHPRLRSILRLVERCAAQYGPALAGDVEAVGVLFSALEEETREEQEGTSASRVYTALAAEVAARLTGLHPGRTVRILEIGAGQGSLSRHVLPLLEGRDVEYWFTDIGKMFLVKAEAEAARQGLGFVRFGRFDISRDPASQGYEPESFDLLLGLNVVHATPDVEQSLRNLRSLLRPGGTLCMIESVQRERWVDMVWGLAEGWWYFEDSFRQGSPLLGLATWHEVLARAGFSVASALPQDEEGARSTYGMFLATPTGSGQPSTDGMAGRTARVRKLRELGAEVVVDAADVADLEAMRGVAARAIERWGRIDGVIHSAGLPGGGLLAMHSRETLDGEIRAKVQGTLVIGELCREILSANGSGFLALCSSQNSFTGQLGQAAYSAGNNFMDAYAHWHMAEIGTPTVTMNWARWQGVGMAVAVERQHKALTGEDLTGGISPAEGREAFERALASGLTQVVVSRADFGSWLEGVRALDPAAALSRLERAPTAPVHERTLETEYTPPGDELEEQLAEIWQEVFGIERIGAHDDFFALGGDSLVALQMVSRIGKAFGVELKVGQLFETPTIAGLAVALEEAMLDAAAPDEIERALDQMEVPHE
jgi:amino acid adenylation domain-containing protein